MPPILPGAAVLVWMARSQEAPETAERNERARFRPILLTSITTVAGLPPLLLQQSLQAQILIPLTASLAFGLASATIVAMFLVPAIYMILDDFHLIGALRPEPVAYRWL